MHGRAHGLAIFAAALALAASGSAYASPVCDRLRSEWAASGSADRQATMQEAYERQRDEIDALEERMRQVGCSVGSVMVFGGPHEEDCHRMNALLSDMDRNLRVLGDSLEGPDPREVIAEAMRSNGCAGAPPPISGVSQFNNPSAAAIQDLTPGAPVMVTVPEPGHESSVIHPSRAEPARREAPKELFLPPDLGPLPEAEARPMTDREKNVRTVGPTFLPAPSEDIDFDALPPKR
jgi:hypothetical protein